MAAPKGRHVKASQDGLGLAHQRADMDTGEEMDGRNTAPCQAGLPERREEFAGWMVGIREGQGKGIGDTSDRATGRNRAAEVIERTKERWGL